MPPQPTSFASGPVDSGSPVSLARTTVISVGSTVVVALPVMFIGALSILMTEIDFDEASLGAGVSIYFLVAGLSSMFGGRLADRLPARVTVRLGLGCSSAALLGVAILAREWWHIAVALLVAGMATGLVHPTVNMVLARQVPTGLQGLLFGAKQSAVPAAALLAGFAVPVFTGLGWRWAFASAAICAIAVTYLVPPWRSLEGQVKKSDRAPIPRVSLALSSVGGALASGAANAMAIFFVLFGVSVGLAAETAGALLMVGSISGIAARIAVGHGAGRMRQYHFVLVAGLVFVGSIGYFVLSLATGTPAIVVGVVLGFAAGWGWPGVMLLGVIRISPEAPGTASGIVQGATFLGAVIGPAVFGQIVAHGSYQLAWRTLSLAAVVGALFMGAAAMAGRETMDRRSVSPVKGA